VEPGSVADDIIKMRGQQGQQPAATAPPSWAEWWSQGIAPADIPLGIQRGLERGGPIAGGVIGGIIGAPLGPFGVAGGAGLGSALGYQLPNITRPFLTGEPSPTLPEAALGAAQEFGAGVAGEGIGTATGKVTRWVKDWRPFRTGGPLDVATQKVRETAAQTQEYLKRGGSYLTTAQQLGTQGPQRVEEFAKGAFFPSRKYAALRAEQPQVIEKQIREYVNAVGTQMGDEGLGQLLLDALQGSRGTIRGATRRAFREIDRLATGVQVDTTSFVNAVEAAIKRGGKPGGPPVLDTLKAAGIPREAYELLGKTRRGAVETIKSAKFSDVLKLREQLEAVAERTPVTLKEQEIVQTAGDLVSKLNEAIDAAGRRLPASAQLEYQTIQSLGAGGRAGLDNTTIREVITKLRDRPEKYADLLLQPKNSTALQRIKAAVSPEEWQSVQAGLSQEFLRRATNPSSQLLVGTDLMRQLHQLGPETVQAAFGTQAAGLRKLAEAMEFVQRESQLEGADRVLVRIGQGRAISEAAGAIGTLAPLAGASIGWTPAGLTLLLSPKGLGWLLANPKVIDWLTEGLKGSARSPEVQRKLGQVVAHVTAWQLQQQPTAPPTSPAAAGQRQGLGLRGQPAAPVSPREQARQQAIGTMDKSLQAMEAYKQAVEQYRAGTQPAPAPLPVPPLPNLQQTPLVPGPAFP
jgi:hypothetical protein